MAHHELVRPIGGRGQKMEVSPKSDALPPLKTLKGTWQVPMPKVIVEVELLTETLVEPAVDGVPV